MCGISQFINRLIVRRNTMPDGLPAVRSKLGVITALLCFTLTLNVWALVKYHPYQLSYYNAVIGGPAGAAKKGFTISYWYEALNQVFFNKLNARYKNDPVTIFSFPNSEILEYNRVLGMVSYDAMGLSSSKVLDRFPFDDLRGKADVLDRALRMSVLP